MPTGRARQGRHLATLCNPTSVAKTSERSARAKVLPSISQRQRVLQQGQTARLVVDGLAGDDDIQVDGNVTATVMLFGGDGNDRLKGGSGNNVLVGMERAVREMKQLIG